LFGSAELQCIFPFAVYFLLLLVKSVKTVPKMNKLLLPYVGMVVS